LASSIAIAANAFHKYWVNIRVNGHLLRVQVDTGMTQEACEVGLALTHEDFDRLSRSRESLHSVAYEGAGLSAPSTIPTMAARVSIEGLDDAAIETRIARIGSNIVGVCFFHRLPGFELVWDFASRTMIIRRIQGVRTQ
jgi:predicted aspartyl protease